MRDEKCMLEQINDAKRLCLLTLLLNTAIFGCILFLITA